MVHRAGQASGIRKRVGQPVFSFRIIGVQAQRILVMRDGRGGPAGVGERVAPVEFGHGETRPHAQRLRELRLRLVPPPHQGQRIAEIVVGLGIAGLQPQRLAVMGDRLDGAARAPEDDAEVVVRQPAVRVLRQGRAVERLLVPVYPALAPRQDPEGQDDGKGGRRREDCPAGPAAPEAPARRRPAQKPQARQVLEMVGDEGKDEGVDVEKAQRRKKRAKKIESGCQRAPGAHGKRKNQNRCGDRGRIQPKPRRSAPGGPPRVDEAQVEWPRQLPEVKAGGPPGDQEALRPAKAKRLPLRADVRPLDP